MKISDIDDIIYKYITFISVDLLRSALCDLLVLSMYLTSDFISCFNIWKFNTILIKHKLATFKKFST